MNNISPFTLHLGDCLESMRGMADNSVDTCISDPPYGLSNHKPDEVLECLRAWIAGDVYAPKGNGFMGKSWDAWVPGPEVWREVMRVLKPGGHVLAFAGTRSMDLMSMAIRLAGFELRDAVGYAHDGGGAPLLAWSYGSGFPKSMDVSKQIDKRGGESVSWFGPWLRDWRELRGLTQKYLCERCGFFGSVNRGGTVANWELGLGTPTVSQFNTICDILKLPFASMQEAEREVIGTKKAAPGVAFSSKGPTELDITAPATEAARQWSGWGTALKPAWEPIILARKPLATGNTVAANVLQWGTGAVNIDKCRISGETPVFSNKGQSAENCYGDGLHGSSRTGEVSTQGRWPANLILEDCEAVRAGFPVTGASSGSPRVNKASASIGTFATVDRVTQGVADTGGSAARFFKQVTPEAEDFEAARFMYCAKASRADRDSGLDGFEAKTGVDGTRKTMGGGPMLVNNTAKDGVAKSIPRANIHPTVKPTDLMAYLCRLVTPPGGTILDPFCGSGSTGKAAIREGFNFIGCELDPEYLEIARARIQHELNKI